MFGVSILLQIIILLIFSEDIINKTDNINDNNLCVICMVKQKTHAYVHYNKIAHLAVCDACTNIYKTQKCPVCREDIKSIIKIFS